jgi:hypothetical protein
MKDWYTALSAQPGTGATMTYSVSTYVTSIFYRVRVSHRLQP